MRESTVWNSEWDAKKASEKAEAFAEEQKRLHEEKLAKRKADREKARRDAKIKPVAEYPWLKKDSGEP